MKWTMALLGATALLTVTAQAEDPPRVMTGVFCNTPEDIKAVLDNRALDMGAIDLVNKDTVKCVLHDGNTSSVFATKLRFLRQDTFGKDTMYLYEVTIEGFYFGKAGRKVDPPVMQYAYLLNPIDPSHKSTDA